jgi:threonine/homoserine/homoserine lactone efflux protein
VACGQAFWTLAASLGLAALLSASEPAFLAVRLAGAAYLIFLGIRTFFGSRHTHARTPGVRGAFRQGLISNLGNPKMAVFFTSLLPQFGGSSFATLVGLGLVFCTMTLVWLSAYAFAVARAGDFLRRKKVRRVLDAVTGTVLVGLGIRLAAEHR